MKHGILHIAASTNHNSIYITTDNRHRPNASRPQLCHLCHIIRFTAGSQLASPLFFKSCAATRPMPLEQPVIKTAFCITLPSEWFYLFEQMLYRHTSSCMCVGCAQSPESLTDVKLSGIFSLAAFLQLELFSVYYFYWCIATSGLSCCAIQSAMKGWAAALGCKPSILHPLRFHSNSFHKERDQWNVKLLCQLWIHRD